MPSYSPIIRTLVSTDGTKIYAEAVGAPSKPSIVFVHGFGASSTVFDGMFNDERLLTEFRLVRYDLRGFGRSGMPKTENDLVSRLFADDFATVLKEFDLICPVFVGWSLGGVITTDICAHLDPIPISGVVYLAGVPTVSSVSKVINPSVVERVGIITDLNTTSSTYVSALLEHVESYFEDLSSVPFTLKSSWIGQAFSQPPQVSSMMFNRFQDPTKLVEAGGKGLPALSIVGTKDNIAEPSAWFGELRKIFADIKHVEVVGGHAIHYEKQNEVVDALLDFALHVTAGKIDTSTSRASL